MECALLPASCSNCKWKTILCDRDVIDIMFERQMYLNCIVELIKSQIFRIRFCARNETTFRRKKSHTIQSSSMIATFHIATNCNYELDLHALKYSRSLPQSVLSDSSERQRPDSFTRGDDEMAGSIFTISLNRALSRLQTTYDRASKRLFTFLQLVLVLQLY